MLLAMLLAMLLVVSVVLLMAASIASLGSRIDGYQTRARQLWAALVLALRPIGLNLSDVFLPSRAISGACPPTEHGAFLTSTLPSPR